MGAADLSRRIDQLWYADADRGGNACVATELSSDGLGQHLDVSKQRRRAALRSGRHLVPERNCSTPKLDRAGGDLRAADIDADAPFFGLARARRVHLALLAPVGRRDAEQQRGRLATDVVVLVRRARREIAAVTLGQLQPARPRFTERTNMHRAGEDVDRLVAAMALGFRSLTRKEVDAADSEMFGRDEQSH